MTVRDVGGLRPPVCSTHRLGPSTPSSGWRAGCASKGLAAAAACALTRGSLSLLDRLPPPPSSARTYLPITQRRGAR
eukprot:1850993-Prymnesium_polylepis.1